MQYICLKDVELALDESNVLGNTNSLPEKPMTKPNTAPAPKLRFKAARYEFISKI